METEQQLKIQEEERLRLEKEAEARDEQEHAAEVELMKSMEKQELDGQSAEHEWEESQ